ncbi:hypothetical protein BT63DRAFT_428221 [Microthyrium microscopicum]|uniref:DUF7735 domain-containing protein n=1 Tax=Microthyrium microscopicum TaxID=703497 RepID=A0A6A6U488_9PEZI|nr:hypothetical protein BT63DRAFT_428221 [Microthyrium microscopicum]
MKIISFLAATVAANSLLEVPPSDISPQEMSQLVPSRTLNKAFPTTDHPDCSTPDYQKLFSIPKPTGQLNEALESYGSSLLKPCTLTGVERTLCPFPPKTAWCAFPTAAPAAVLPAWSSYGSEASAFWASRGSTMLVLARTCPEHWYNALYGDLGNPIRLNNTIVQAECYADAHATGATTTASSTMGASSSRATVRAGASDGGPTVTPTSTTKSGSGRSRGINGALGGTGLVVAVIHWMW